MYIYIYKILRLAALRLVILFRVPDLIKALVPTLQDLFGL